MNGNNNNNHVRGIGNINEDASELLLLTFRKSPAITDCKSAAKNKKRTLALIIILDTNAVMLPNCDN